MAKLYYGDERVILPHEFSVESDPPRFTGILDANGHPIYEPRQPVGFVTDFTAHKPRVRVKAWSSPVKC